MNTIYIAHSVKQKCSIFQILRAIPTIPRAPWNSPTLVSHGNRRDSRYRQRMNLKTLKIKYSSNVPDWPPSFKDLPNPVAEGIPSLLAEEDEETSQEFRYVIHPLLTPGHNLLIQGKENLLILRAERHGWTPPSPLSNLQGFTHVYLIQGQEVLNNLHLRLVSCHPLSKTQKIYVRDCVFLPLQWRAGFSQLLAQNTDPSTAC